MVSVSHIIVLWVQSEVDYNFRGENRIAEKSLLLTKKQELEYSNDKREDEGPRSAYFSRE